MVAVTGTREICIRPAERKDCEAIMRLKKQLAAHQNMQDKKMLSYQELERDGFDADPPLFRCLVAEAVVASSDQSELEPEEATQGAKREVIGFALYFYAYAAWEGKVIHLEDFCVSIESRGEGVGSKLLKELAKIGVEGNFSRIQLEALNSNDTAIKFYKKHGGIDFTTSEGWHSCRFDTNAIKVLALKKDEIHLD